MKKLFVILLGTVLISCVTVLDPPKSNTDYKNIIGKPIKIGNIEVAEYDFPKKMNWEDAKKACEALGDGWKLPNQEELYILYANQNRISGFSESTYWSSTEVGKNGAWHQYFSDGAGSDDDKNVTLYVRAIRALEKSAALESPTLEPPKSNTDYKNIIGKPIKIGNIEVAQYDFPKKMDWNDAKIFCADLGEGWKLPSQEELNILYQNKVAIGGFSNNNYWSSTEASSKGAWDLNFGDGEQFNRNKRDTYNVRAVRAF